MATTEPSSFETLKSSFGQCMNLGMHGASTAADVILSSTAQEELKAKEAATADADADADTAPTAEESSASSEEEDAKAEVDTSFRARAGACMGAGLTMGTDCLLGPDEQKQQTSTGMQTPDRKEQLSKLKPAIVGTASTEDILSDLAKVADGTQGSPRGVKDLNNSGETAKFDKDGNRVPMEPEELEVPAWLQTQKEEVKKHPTSKSTFKALEAVVLDHQTSEQEVEVAADPAHFEAAFEAFVDSRGNGGPITSSRITELRSQLANATNARYQLETDTQKEIEEEKRMSKEIEAALSAQLEAAQKDKERAMAKLHADLVEETRAKNEAITDIKAKIEQAQEEKALVVAALNSKLAEAVKDKAEAELQLQEQLNKAQSHKAQTQRDLSYAKDHNDHFLQKEVQDTLQTSNTPPRTRRSISGGSTGSGSGSLHATHLRMARMQRVPSQGSASPAATSDGVGYATERTNKHLREAAAFESEVRRLREQWEAQHGQPRQY